MKTYTLLFSATLIASTNALPSFLASFPNSDVFSKDSGGNGQKLGHLVPSIKNTELGMLYNANRDWSKLCKLTFPGTQMTIGAAFGDPCCEWTSGPAPQKITPWTDKPTATTCSKSGGGGTGGTPPASGGGGSPSVTASGPTPANPTPNTSGNPSTPGGNPSPGPNPPGAPPTKPSCQKKKRV